MSVYAEDEVLSGQSSQHKTPEEGSEESERSEVRLRESRNSVLKAKLHYLNFSPTTVENWRRRFSERVDMIKSVFQKNHLDRCVCVINKRKTRQEEGQQSDPGLATDGRAGVQEDLASHRM